MTIFRIILLALPLISLPAFAGWDDVNMSPGATALGQEIFGLHMTIFWICFAIGVAVLGAMAFILFKYRKKEGVEAAKFDDSTFLEFTWTILFALILIGMSIPATITMIRAYDDTEGDINILITGHQWKWQYEYIEDEVSFFSNLSTSLDAIPGFVNTGWTQVNEPGIFRGQCTELCGQYHGYMPIVVEAVSPDEYKEFIIQKKEAKLQQAALTEKLWTTEELMAMGEGVYQKNCVACHQVNGEGLAPVFPALAGSDIVMNDKARQIEILMEGVQGAAMQSYAEQLTEVEIAAVITYTRKSWGNDASGTGEIVAPKEILDYKTNKL